MDELPPRVQVLVVGAGPAGLVAGITLATYGVDVLVVDRRDGSSPLSRALVISTRGMELMRRWGLEDVVRAGAADVEPCAWVTPTLASGEGREMPLGFPSDEEAARVSPTRPAWAPQDHHEPILLAHLQSAPSAAVRFGCELIELTQDARAAHAVLVDGRSGKTRRVSADYVVAADGAHSVVRQQLGIAMIGSADLGDYGRVEFVAPLADIVGDRRYALYVISGPDSGGGVFAPRGRSGRWGLSREQRPGELGLGDLGEDALVALIARAAGVDDLRATIERVSTFAFAAQISERYRDGRAFLVGDAAHRMTPRGGTGMNTAIQDSFDLGWKLGWVLRGWADATLLDSYDEDRRPVGLHNVERTGDPGGAQRPSEEALPWDLNGRIAHHWLERDGQAVSTVDLVGDGLTLFTGPDGLRWTSIDAHLPWSAPVRVHRLDATTAAALAIEPIGALLLRPDGRELRRWASVDEALTRHGEL
jgi:2-polyprenyl-6-methoxyphenol hydroxylase-like FAD-dependent oxidoreductase